MTPMRPDNAWYADLDLDQKARLLARLAYEITLDARATYRAGRDDVTNLYLVRELNEIQHSVTGCLYGLLGSPGWDDFGLEMLDHEDPELREIFHRSWISAVRHIQAP